MAASTIATIRQTIAASIQEACPTWRESGQVYARFPGSERHPIVGAPLYAVSVLSTEIEAPLARQRRGALLVAVSTVGVRLATPLRAHAGPADEDAASEPEASLVAALVGPDQPYTLELQRVRRDVLGEGTVYLTEVTVRVSHYYPVR